MTTTSVNSATGQNERASVANDGATANGQNDHPTISANGARVAFVSWATNLVPGLTTSPGVYVRDLTSGVTVRADVTDDGQAPGGSDGGFVAISADGRYVAFASSSPLTGQPRAANHSHIYVRDSHTSKTRLISRTADRAPGNGDSFAPSISSDGRYVVFASRASNLDNSVKPDGLVHVYLADLTLEKTRIVDRNLGGKPADRDSASSSFFFWGTPQPVVTGDGNAVTFISQATNLTGEQAEGEGVYVRTMDTGKIVRADLSSRGNPAGGFSYWATLTPDARYVLFCSSATNLATPPGNGESHLYLRDLKKGSTTRIDSTPQGQPGNVHAGCPAALTPDATHIVTFTGSTNLVDDDLHGQDNILMFTGYR